MSHSNSSLNCFASCMAKYDQNYIQHNKPDKISPHLTFGTMAHEVLYNAGRLRDDVNDGVVNKDDYYRVIPSEIDYAELKSEFGIKSWQGYFVPVIKQTAEYENDLVKELRELDGSVMIEREVKLQMTITQLQELGIYGIDQPLVGVIDLLLYTSNSAIILDYKFSTSRKSQSDFDENSQLPLYAFMVHTLYDIPLHNIKVGYIDIPKQSFENPILLKNGTLSRSKSQNCSAELYKAAVEAVHGDDEYYNCEPGGYYREAYCNMQLNKAAYLSIQYIDLENYSKIISDLIKAAKMIDFMRREKMPFLRKYDAYSCKGCEYKKHCKPWLNNIWEE